LGGVPFYFFGEPAEVKWDGYRVIARKDGERVRLWARTTSDYTNAFTRIRDALAARLPDGERLRVAKALVVAAYQLCPKDCGGFGGDCAGPISLELVQFLLDATTFAAHPVRNREALGLVGRDARAARRDWRKQAELRRT
jgi:hypothetical protein